MAEKISDDKFKYEMLEFKTEMSDFKTEVMKFVEVANHKFDGLTADVRTNAFKLDKLENGLNRVEEKLEGVSTDLKQLSRQFNDVGGMAIKDSARIDELEKRVDVLEAQAH